MGTLAILPMTAIIRRSVLASFLLALAVGLLAGSASASGNGVLSDYSDNGQLNQCYSQADYAAALKQLRPDQQQYGAAADVIQQAQIECAGTAAGTTAASAAGRQQANEVNGRAVLADLPRHFARTGRDWGAMGGQRASAEDVAACLAAQGVALRPGDILLVRTGWLAAFRAAPDADARHLLIQGEAGARDYSGLDGGEGMWRFLWDQGIAAVAADNPTVEAWPIFPWKPALHLAIARLGLCLGEFFDFEELAEDSAATGRYTAFFTAAPLNHRGGIGSPGNALAIR
jgi:kynurenine formamidase